MLPDTRVFLSHSSKDKPFARRMARDLKRYGATVWFGFSPWMVVVSSLGVILAAGYVLWMVKRVFYGEVTNPKNLGLPDLSAREATVLVPLVVLAIVMGLLSPAFTRRIEPAADALVQKVRERTQPTLAAEAASQTAQAGEVR